MAPHNQRHKGLRSSNYRERVNGNPKRLWYKSEQAEKGQYSFLKR